MEEIWKQYTNGYWVSNFGNSLNKDKKPIIRYSKNNGRYLIGNKSVSRAVYELFVGPIPKDHSIYHKDTNPLNNSVDNLIALFPSRRPGVDLKRTTLEDFVFRSREVHGEKYDYSNSEFHGMGRRINILCKSHGEFNQVCSDHVAGHGCSFCAKDKQKTWTDEQDEFLTQNYKNLGVVKCSQQLEKTQSAVASRAVYIGISEKSKIHLHPNIPAATWSGIVSRTNSANTEERSQLDFEINYIWELYLKQDKKCALTGWEIVFDKKNSTNTTASVDRIDSSLGYTKANTQLIHKDVNIMKNRFDESFFYRVCDSISKNRREDYNPRVLKWVDDIWNDTIFPIQTRLLDIV